MVAVLKETGLDPIVPEGGYFIVVDMSRLGKTDMQGELEQWSV